jgi:hypothetical protein
MGKYLSVASWLLLFGGLMVSLPTTVGAQNVPGVTGTVQPDSGRGDTDAAGHIVAGGLKSIFRGKDGDDEWLKQLREGTPVALRYAKQGNKQSAAVKPDRDVTDDPTTEGTVTEIDRKAKTIVIRFTDRSRQTFRLADNQPADARQEMVPGPDEVVVSFLDQAGRRIGRNFKKAS